MVDKNTKTTKPKTQKTKKVTKSKTQKKQGKSTMAEKSAKNTKNAKKEVGKFVKVEESVENIESSYHTIGDELKAARLEKKVSLKDISEELNIKVSQLEAIEKGDTEALPEMIYAAGFVRNYADYLGVDSKYASDKFKDEHSGEPNSKAKDFAFPEPLYENSVPGPTILGIGAFLSIAVLIAWIVYSNVDSDKEDMGANSSAVTASVEKSEDSNILSSNKMKEPEFVETVPAKMESVEEKVRTVAVTKEEAKSRNLKKAPSAATVADSGENNLKTLPSARSNQLTEIDVKVVETNKPNMEGFSSPEEKPAKQEVKIKKKTAAVMLKAKEASWIQVTDKNQKVIFRKVLRPGDEYVVPNKKGLTLVTANAGGLEVYVRGKKVQSIGKPGEIVRGVALNPDELKLRRIKSRR